jgi:hypothetical protein
VAEVESQAEPKEETRAALAAEVEASGDDAGETPPPPAHDEPPAGHEAHGMAGEGGHGDDHHDAHHEEEPLGPLDWRAWGAAALGVALAGVIAALLYLVSYPA